MWGAKPLSQLSMFLTEIKIPSPNHTSSTALPSPQMLFSWSLLFWNALSSPAQAALTEITGSWRRGGEVLKQQTIISHRSGGWKSNIKVSALSESWSESLYGSHCVLMWWREGSPCASLYKDTNPIMGAPPSWPHLNLTSSQRSHLSIPSHWGLGLQHMNLGGIHSVYYIYRKYVLYIIYN